MSGYKETALGNLSRLVHYFKQARLASLDKLGLYPGQPRLLNFLFQEEGISQRDLAERMHIAPATLSRMIGRMEKYGYLERRPDGRDQRITRIYPASGARLVMEKLDCVNREMEGDLFKGFSEREKEEFLEYAKRICDNMQRAKTPIARVCLQEEKQI